MRLEKGEHRTDTATSLALPNVAPGLQTSSSGRTAEIPTPDGCTPRTAGLKVPPAYVARMQPPPNHPGADLSRSRAFESRGWYHGASAPSGLCDDRCEECEVSEVRCCSLRVLVAQDVLNRPPSVHGPNLHVIYLGMPTDPVRRSLDSLMESHSHRQQTIRDIYHQT